MSGASLPARDAWGKRLHLAAFLLDFRAVMVTKTLSRQGLARRKVSSCRCGRAVSLVVAIVSACCLPGCQKNVEIPPIEVKDVEAYGMTLDESATPQQVVYVLLRSLRDDFEAAQARDRERQKEAMRTTFSLAAFSEIEKRLARTFAQAEGKTGTELGAHRDRKIYDVINHWTPIVGHYVRGFDLEMATAIAKMKVVTPENGSSAHVYYDVSHDPQETDPAKQQRATLDVELAKEKATAGARMYWRVVRVAFRGPDAQKRVAPTSGPEATATSPG